MKTFIKIMTLMIVLMGNAVAATSGCQAGETRVLNFIDGEKVVEADDLVGDVYRYTNVGGTEPMDALITIVEASGAEIHGSQYDVESQGDIPSFQPRIRSLDTTGEVHIKWHIKLVESGTDTLVNPNGLNFRLTAFDVDGYGTTRDIREYAEFEGWQGYILDNGSTVEANIDDTVLRLMPNNSRNVSGTSTFTENAGTVIFKDTNEFTYTTGVKHFEDYVSGAGSRSRRFGLRTDCFEYHDPIVYRNPSMALVSPSPVQANEAVTLSYVIQNPNNEEMTTSIVLDYSVVDDYDGTLLDESEIPFLGSTTLAGVTVSNPGSTISVLGNTVHIDGFTVPAFSSQPISVNVLSDSNLVAGTYYTQGRLEAVHYQGVQRTLGTVMSDDPETYELDKDPTNITVTNGGNNMCIAPTGSISENDFHIVSKSTSDSRILVASSVAGTPRGDIMSYAMDSEGDKAGNALWSAEDRSSTANRTLVMKSFYEGTIVNIANLPDTAFNTVARSATDIKQGIITPDTGFISSAGKDNGMYVVESQRKVLTYLRDASYRSYYNSEVAARIPTVFSANDDGFIYAIDARNGDTIWAFLPGGLLPQVHDYDFTSRGHGAGDIQLVTAKDNSGSYHEYLVGTYDAGKGFYVVRLVKDTSGYLQLEEVIVDDYENTAGQTQSYELLTTDGLTYVIYSKGRDIIVRELSNGDVFTTIDNGAYPTGDMSLSDVYFKNTLYVPTGDTVNMYQLVDASDNLVTDVSRLSVAIPDLSGDDEVTQVGVVNSRKSRAIFMHVSTRDSITVMFYDKNTSVWKAKWKSGINTHATWGNDGKITDTSIQSLTTGTSILARPVLVKDTLIVSTTVVDPTSNNCLGDAVLYMFNLSDGYLPTVVYRNGSVISSSKVIVGKGIATKSVLNSRGAGALNLYSKVSQGTSTTEPEVIRFSIVDPVDTGVRSWKELD